MRSRSVAFVAALTLLAAGCSWGQWGGGAEHRGNGFAPTLTSASVGGWTARSVSAFAPTVPVVDAHGLLLTARDGRLVALDPRTGAVVWGATLPAGTTAGGTLAVFESGARSTVFVTVAEPAAVRLLGFDVDGVRNCDPLDRECGPVLVATLATAPGRVTPVLVLGNRVLAHGAQSLRAFDATATTNCTTIGSIASCTPLWSTTVGTTVAGIGPVGAGPVVYDAGTNNGNPVVHAIDAATGTVSWRGTLPAAATATPGVSHEGRVFVPAGAAVPAFAGAGCGSATCSAQFSLTSPPPAAPFLSTPAFDGATVYATNGNGNLHTWSATGCGAATCAPLRSVTVDAPPGGTTTYAQSPVTASGIVSVVGRQSVSGVLHARLRSFDDTNNAPLANKDLGTAGFGPGLTSLSLNSGVFHVPLADGIHAVGPRPARLTSLSVSPLGIGPAFDPAVHDYVVRCAAGSNSLTVSAAAASGGTVRIVSPVITTPGPSLSRTVAVQPDAAIVLEAADPLGELAEYWVRCLPPDFPSIQVTRSGAGPTPGWYVFSNNIPGPTAGQFAMITDERGTPVWYTRATPAINVTPLAKNTVAWLPTSGFAFGTDPNGRYDVHHLETGAVTSLRTQGVRTDFHELQRLPNGNHLMLSYEPKGGFDLTGLVGQPDAGPNSTIADCIIQEVAPNGNAVWQWRGSDHFDIVGETTTEASTVQFEGQTIYDVFHCNSVDPSPSGNGDVLLSIRHMNAVVEIRRSDGRVLWKLGGTPTNGDGAQILRIEDDPQGGPAQQHDARYLPDGHISMYDNQSGQTGLPARGAEYAVDLAAGTATLVFSHTQPEAMTSCCMGSFRHAPDGHWVIGWGYFVFGNGRAFNELDADGTTVLDVNFGAGAGEYRVIKVPPTMYDANVLRRAIGR